LAAVIGIFIYLGFQILLGIWLSKKIATESDYLVAGRKLGFGLTTFGVFAIWFAAEGVLSTSGAAFQEGIPSITTDHLAWGVGVILLGIFFAASLRRQKFTTLGDLYRKRYGRMIERITVLLLVPVSIFWAAGQIRAFGVVIAAFSDINTSLAISIAAGAIIIIHHLWRYAGRLLHRFHPGGFPDFGINHPDRIHDRGWRPYCLV